MTRKRVGIIGTGIVAITVALLYLAQPLAGETCLGVYENANGGGDTMSICDTNISNVKIANLTQYTTGLNNGCSRVLNTSSTWNDCISSVRLANLPANTKAVFYQNTVYAGQVACVDVNGASLTNITGSANDVISSFRLLGGNCP